jgi:hypothetical protein
MICGLSIAVALLVPSRADAKLWDWMQEWSGPGPFSANLPMWLWSVCPKDKSLAAPDDPPCFYLAANRLKSPDDGTDNFPIAVTAHFFEIGMTRNLALGPIKRAIQGGAGVGVLLAYADKDKGGKTMVRPYVMAPRVTLKPVVAVLELRHKPVPDEGWAKLLHVVKVQIGAGVIIGPFGPENLLEDPTRSTFKRRKAEYVLSRGFALDFGELVRTNKLHDILGLN